MRTIILERFTIEAQQFYICTNVLKESCAYYALLGNYTNKINNTLNTTCFANNTRSTTCLSGHPMTLSIFTIHLST